MKIGEPYTFGMQCVNMGSLYMWVSMASKVSIAHVIRQDNDHIGALLRLKCLMKTAEQ
jgi:hypothetical protein